MDIYAFWSAVLRQDADAIRTFFHPEAGVRWHCTNESFTVDEFIRANCEYPGDWDGEVERIERAGGLIVTVARVWPRDRSCAFHVVSFIELRGGRIAALDEYWGDDGPAPEWRREMRIGRKIR